MKQFLSTAVVEAFVANNLDAVRGYCAELQTADGPRAYMLGVLTVFERDVDAAMRYFADAVTLGAPIWAYEAIVSLCNSSGHVADASYWRKEAALALADSAQEDTDNFLLSLDTVFPEDDAAAFEVLRQRINSAIGRQPTCAAAWSRLAELEYRDGNHAASEQAYRHAVLYRPSAPGDYAALALVLASREAFDEAMEFLRRAEFLGFAVADIYLTLVRLLRAGGRMADAEETIATATRRCGDQADFLLEMATLRAVQNKTDEAREKLNQVFDLHPEDGIRLRRALQLPVIIPEFEELRRRRITFETEIRALADDALVLGDPLETVGFTNFYSAYQGVDDYPVQVELARIIRRGAPMLNEVAPYCRAYRGPEGDRIRVGFVSSYFYDHTIAKIYADVVKSLPRDRFEVHVFAPAGRDDRLTQYIGAAADAVHVLPATLGAARDDIAACRFDAIIFPDIGMMPLTYYLAFCRMAPVQAVGWGHPVTTGIDTVDYFLSSELWEPDDADLHYTEKLVRFPGLGAAPLVIRPPMSPKQRVELGLDASARIYICPQSLFKFHPEFDDVLDEILRQDAEAQLVLIDGVVPEWRESLLRRICCGRPELESRIDFLPRLSEQDFLAAIGAADVMLDTMHFSGGMTTLEGLSMGTPVVTLPSAYLRGRVTAGLLRRLGLEECIASDVSDYVAKAIAFASNHDRRHDFAAKVAANWHRIVDRQADVAEIAGFLEDAVAAAAGHTQD